MKKILIVNKQKSDNFGDQAIHYCISKIITDFKIDFDSIDLTRFKKDVNKAWNKKIVKRNGLLKTIYNLKITWVLLNFMRIYKLSKKEYSIIIYGGGQLIINNNQFSVALYIYSFLFKKSKQILLSVGCSESFSWLNTYLYMKSLSRMDRIYSRDMHSEINLKRNFDINSKLVYDLAFTMSMYTIFHKKEISSTGYLFVCYEDFKKYNSISREKYTDYCVSILNNDTSARIKLLYSTLNDYNFALELLDNCSSKFNLELAEINSLNSFIESIHNCNVVVSNRMHALIIALAYNIDVYALPISDKLSGFISEYIVNKKEITHIQEYIIHNLQEIFEIC